MRSYRKLLKRFRSLESLSKRLTQSFVVKAAAAGDVDSLRQCGKYAALAHSAYRRHCHFLRHDEN